MAYGELKVDSITFTNGGADTTVSVSGLVQNPTFSGDITVTGTISGSVVQGGTLVSGATVSGTAGEFGTITGNTAGFTTVTGTTVTGTTVNAVSGVFTTQISGATVTGNTGQFTNITGGAAGFTTVTGTTVTGTTANFVTVSGTTVTGNAGNFTTATVTSGVFASGTAAAPSVSVGTTDNGLYSPGTDEVALSTNGTGRLFVDASGRILVGNSATTNVAGFNGSLQLQGTNFDTATVALTNVAANNTGSYLLLGKARGGTLGGYTSVNNGDNLGQIRFMGADGTGYVEAAYIGVTCNGVPGTNNMPGRLFFSTNSGTSSVTERMCITPSGLVGIGVSSPGSYNSNANTLVVGNTSSNQGITISAGTASASAIHFADGTTGDESYRGILKYEHSNDRFLFGTAGGNTALTIDSSQRVGIGTTSPVDDLTVEAAANAGGITVTRLGGTARIKIYGNPASPAEILFGDTISGAGSEQGRISYDNATDALRFFTNTAERARIDSSGRLLVGTSSQSGGSLFQVNDNRIRIASSKTPASASDTGTAGEICWDSSYIYVCTATNTWKRAALSTW